jgi:hypothetical protein
MRRAIAQWIYRGRIRLGDGLGLEPILADDLAQARRRFPRPKFFIFGHARSGTSFLARLVRQHPDVHCDWQTQFFSERGPIPYFTSPSFRRWLRHPSNRWTQAWDPTAALLRVCCDTILEREAEKAGKRVVGDKSPNENGAQAVRWLAAVYPDAHLLYIVRDGRDTVLSKRVQAFIDQPQTLGRADRRVRQAFIQEPQPFIERRRSLFTPAWLEAAARNWAHNVEGSVAAGRELFGDRFALVRYEALLAEPYRSLTALWTFLGVGSGEAALEAEVEKETRSNPEADWHGSSAFAFVQLLPRGVHGGWRDLYTTADAQLFERAAGNALRQFDYQRPS